jgi:aminoglycoside 3-N-acetyltransferase
MYVPFQEIASQLPVHQMDILLIASDVSGLTYSAVKHKEKFDPNLFIDSFKDKLDGGTLLFPAFVNNFKSGDIFDRKTILPSMGVLSKSAFLRVDFVRSGDPLHSFFATGVHAADIEKIKSVSTFGKDSVFAFLHAHRAKMLLIDVDFQHSFTFVHYVEEKKQVRYRKYQKIKYSTKGKEGGDTDETLLFYRKKKGIVNTLNNLEKMLEDRGALKRFAINGSSISCIDLALAYEIISDEITMNQGKNIFQFHVSEYLRSVLKYLLGKC